MSKYTELTNENFEATTKEGVCLVDFWAPWCGPCRMISPIIEELAEEFEGKATICKVNTDEQAELSTQFAIKSIPTIVFMKDGEIVETMMGARSKQEFSDQINKLL